VGKDDILAKGLGKADHPGRVRGVGTLASHNDVFTKQNHFEGQASMSQCKQIAKLTTTVCEVTQVALIALKASGIDVPTRFAHLDLIGLQTEQSKESHPMKSHPKPHTNPTPPTTKVLSNKVPKKVEVYPKLNFYKIYTFCNKSFIVISYMLIDVERPTMSSKNRWWESCSRW
jgi:hypothetical protein